MLSAGFPKMFSMEWSFWVVLIVLYISKKPCNYTNLGDAGLKTAGLLRTFNLLICIANSKEGFLQHALKIILHLNSEYLFFLTFFFFNNIPRDWSSMENILNYTDIKVRYKSSGIKHTSKSFYLSEPWVFTYTLRKIIPT